MITHKAIRWVGPGWYGLDQNDLGFADVAMYVRMASEHEYNEMGRFTARGRYVEDPPDDVHEWARNEGLGALVFVRNPSHSEWTYIINVY